LVADLYHLWIHKQWFLLSTMSSCVAVCCLFSSRVEQKCSARIIDSVCILELIFVIVRCDINSCRATYRPTSADCMLSVSASIQARISATRYNDGCKNKAVAAIVVAKIAICIHPVANSEMLFVIIVD